MPTMVPNSQQTRRSIPLLLALLFALTPLAAANAQPPTGGNVTTPATVHVLSESDLHTIHDRFVRSVLPTKEADIARVTTLAATYTASLRSDGTWADVHYGSDARSAWGAAEHLYRTLVIAKAAVLSQNAGKPMAALDTTTLAALKLWTDHDYRNTNWWWNEIGVPELLGEIATLAKPELPADQLAKVVTIMERSKWKAWTGANLTWGVTNQIVRGCLVGDGVVVAEAYDRLYREVRIVGPAEEGIQSDYSFHQHGAQLYNGGYGLTYANDVGRFISYALGTAARIPADKMTIFSRYLLDGEQWMVWKDLFDYSAVGREITRAGKVAVPSDWSVGPISPAGPAYSLGNVVARLAEAPSTDQKALAAFAARLNSDPSAEPFVGDKQFPRSDYMTHRRATYFVSVKMLSNRMQGGEIVNGEGKASLHLSDGATLLYQSGNEYRDIFPAWDWTKVPGTTAIQTRPVNGEFPGVSTKGGSAFVGGVSDGTYGVCTMCLARGPLTAEKSWFFFDDAFVCLGTGINLSRYSGDSVVTDVNQARLIGDVISSASPKPMATGQYDMDQGSGAWINHDHVGYLFGPKSHVHISLGLQTGRWSDFGAGTSDPVTISIFDAWIDHGKECKNETYQYVVLPGASAAETAARSKNPGIDILANTEDVQAVYCPSTFVLGAVFRKPTTVATPIGDVTADKPCVLMIHDTAHSREYRVSNPENLPLTVHVTVGKDSVDVTWTSDP